VRHLSYRRALLLRSCSTLSQSVDDDRNGDTACVLHHEESLATAQTSVDSFTLFPAFTANMHSASTLPIQTQRVQNNAARIMLPRRPNAKLLLYRLQWFPIKQRILYKTAVITFKVRQTSTQADPHNCAQHLRSSDTSLLAQPTSPGAVSICRHQLFGTLIPEQYSTACHSQSPSPDSKPTAFPRLMITPSNYMN